MSEAGEAGESTVRAYYEAIDAGDYDRFADLLAPGVVHERPDRTIEGRETLVGFMRDGRPNADTSHEVEAVYRRIGGDDGNATDETEVESEDRDGDEDSRRTGLEVADRAVRGRLLDADGTPMFAFVDAFEVERTDGDRGRSETVSGRITRIRTYTR